MDITPSNLLAAVRYFSDLSVCNAHMRRIKWPDGVCCHHCGSTAVYELSTRPVLKCRDCKKQFSYKVGTIFEDSPLGLDKWFVAVWAIANCKNGRRTPPAVILQIDHIHPQSDGGTNDEGNLITACSDCNSGKSDVPLELTPPGLVERTEAIAERREQLAAYEELVRLEAEEREQRIAVVDSHYTLLYPKYEFSERFKRSSLRRFLDYYTVDQLCGFLDIAAAKFPRDSERVIRYFCGICWGGIKQDGRENRRGRA